MGAGVCTLGGAGRRFKGNGVSIVELGLQETWECRDKFHMFVFAGRMESWRMDVFLGGRGHVHS